MMNKRTFLLTVFQSVCFAAFCQSSGHAGKPNILWVTIEDTSPQFIGAYGNADARTPNMDRLAKNGIRFTNAFSTGTVCSPSRSAIITGVKTYKLGTGHHRSQVLVPGYIKGFPHYLKEQGYYATNNAKTDYNIANPQAFIKDAWDESSAKAGWWNRKPGQPFFAVFNYNECHQSRTMTWPYEQYKKEVYDQLEPSERISDTAFRLPPIYHDSQEMRKQFARVYNALKLTDKKIGELLNRLQQDHLMDSTIIFFYADHGEGMPRGKTNGIDYGYRVPFVIWFPPMYAHLSPWGKGGMVSDELIDFEDLAPTMVSLAGGKVPEYMKGRVLLGDHRDQKTNLLFLSNDRSDNGPDLTRSVTDGRFMYSRNFMPYQPELRYIRYMEIGDIKQQMRKDLAAGALNNTQRNLFAPRAPEMLYDLINDPWEMHNLANDKKYLTRLKQFREKLDAHIVSEKDILLLPEYETSIIQDTGTPYEYRLHPENFPIEKIYAAAKLSGFRDAATCRTQAGLLKDKNKIARYWAALGLRSQPANLLKPYAKALKAAMTDDYPPVAVTAAAIVYDMTGDAQAVSILKQAFTGDNKDLALLAINYLLYVKDPKPFIADMQKLNENKKLHYNVRAACNDFLGKLGLVENNASTEDQ